MSVAAAFLSTLPARGATDYDSDTGFWHWISIHAPREGSDRFGLLLGGLESDFYPRSPRGERPQGALVGPGEVEISIHAPREGSDVHGRGRHQALPAISIHAPREGSDAGSSGCPWSRGYFYPRSPRGERQDYAGEFAFRQVISIHAPREGSD